MCTRNPVPCPLLADTTAIGSFTGLKSCVHGVTGHDLAAAIDIRHDAPRYMVYKNGKLTKSHVIAIEEEWSKDHVAFLLGCSYSFETALTARGLDSQHAVMRRNVPMYRTSIPLCPAGVFAGGTYVVSMRPYKRSEIEGVRSITRPFVTTHGEPIAWGWDAVKALGIQDMQAPERGDAPCDLNGEPLEKDGDVVPVFWGCGVTPQEAIMRANLEGVVMGHAPGHIIVLDVKDGDVFDVPS